MAGDRIWQALLNTEDVFYETDFYPMGTLLDELEQFFNSPLPVLHLSGDAILTNVPADLKTLVFAPEEDPDGPDESVEGIFLAEEFTHIAGAGV